MNFKGYRDFMVPEYECWIAYVSIKNHWFGNLHIMMARNYQSPSTSSLMYCIYYFMALQSNWHFQLYQQTLSWLQHKNIKVSANYFFFILNLQFWQRKLNIRLGFLKKKYRGKRCTSSFEEQFNWWWLPLKIWILSILTTVMLIFVDNRYNKRVNIELCTC